MITLEDIQRLRLEKRYDEAERLLKEYHQHLQKALQADRKPAFRAANLAMKEKGLCVTCSKPRDPESPSTIRCSWCYKKLQESKKRLRKTGVRIRPFKRRNIPEGEASKFKSPLGLKTRDGYVEKERLQRRRYEEAIKEGRCTRCSKLKKKAINPRTGRMFSQCDDCRELLSSYVKERTVERKRNGECIYCGVKVTKKHKDGRTYSACQPCIEYSNDSRRNNRRE